MEDGASPNIQNDFFNQARREKRRVAVFLNSGKRLTGRIKSFDKFTILLETTQGEQIVFKHAISTVGPSGTSPSPRQREKFDNRMDIDGALRAQAQTPTQGAGDQPEAVPPESRQPGPAQGPE
jgi:host factor-I protein